MKGRDKTKKELIEELAELRRRVADLEKSASLMHADERSTQAYNALLRLFAGAASRKEYMGAVVRLVSIWSGCRYVGVRILNKAGEIPYESYLGFSQEFWESENWLSIHTDQCACIRVLTGKPESQDLPMMTRNGSFYLSNSFKFIQGLTPEQRARFRGACMHCGFKSLAVIPIPLQGKILGVIHIADEEAGKVTLKLVEFLESVAFSIGQAIRKFSAGDDDKALFGHIYMLMESSQDCISLLTPAGRYLCMNTAGYLRHGLDDPDALLNEDMAANILENRDAVRQAVRQAAAGAEAAVQFKSPDQEGRGIWWDAMLTPVRRPDGSIRGILGISRDITARRRGE